MSHFGIQTIQGSSKKYGVFFKKNSQELNENNVIGITPDGPRGPKMKFKDGLISLIKKTNATIIPLTYSAKVKIRLNTWDKFMVIFPFNKFVAIWETF